MRRSSCDRTSASAARRDERLEQQRPLGVIVVGTVVHHEVRTDRAQDVGGVPCEPMLREQLVELVRRAGLDGRLEEIGLAGEPAVDGAGGQARSPGDLLDPGPVVALLGEHVRGRVEETITGRITRLDEGHLGRR